ncbi:hypothetical protein A4G99_18570 [Haladaptatus sp. R4]|uniref:hypothetical protein n=1 Tax=Haladaptatus sp. R4 TaxID=1679489 RepID=UPI0007B493A3|nr:hypothetical protein [Haladaptatus sp. R4]KZN22736.1 hypothetical protein A4G99_18570 [Haladaptatus sp. R4]
MKDGNEKAAETEDSGINRRNVIKKGSLAGLGALGVGGLSATTFSAPADAANICATGVEAQCGGGGGDGTFVQNHDTDSYGDIAGIELATGGPISSNATTIEQGLSWGLNSTTYYTLDNLELTFRQASGPADIAVSDIQYYDQGSETIPTVVRYALDTLWSLSEIPAPSPLSLAPKDNNPISRLSDKDGFTATYPELRVDKTCGTDMLIDFGTDGDCQTGTYEFDVELTADVMYNPASAPADKKDSLSCDASFSIDLTSC